MNIRSEQINAFVDATTNLAISELTARISNGYPIRVKTLGKEGLIDATKRLLATANKLGITKGDKLDRLAMAWAGSGLTIDTCIQMLRKSENITHKVRLLEALEFAALRKN